MAELTHWKKMSNPDYLGAYALEPNKDLVVTIKSVKNEMVMNPSSLKKEECTVAYFQEKGIKPMILNATNCKMIFKLYKTPYVEEWSGKTIGLYIAMVKAFGDVVEALRIRDKIPQTIKLNLKCTVCNEKIEGAGKSSAEQIAKHSLNKFGKELCVNCAIEEGNKNKPKDIL